MTPGRRPSTPPRRLSAAVALLLATIVVVGLQGVRPSPAAALPPGPPSSTPTAAASVEPSPATTAAATPSPTTPSPASTAAARAATGPTAVDDVVTFQAGRLYGYPRDVAYANNDRPGSAPLRLPATTFPDDQPAGARAAADHLSVDLGALGTLFMYTRSPRMAFSSATEGTTGTATARYRIVDADGASAEALLTIVVLPGGEPVYLGVQEGGEASVDVLADDFPGQNADGTTGTIDRTSVHFTTYSGGPGSTVSGDGRTLTDPVKGVFTADPTTGVVTFRASRTYRGTSEPFTDDHVSYVARDTTRAADGTVRHQSYRVPIYLSVQVVDPLPVPDSAVTPYLTPVTLPGLTDDRAGAPWAPLAREKTSFVRPPSGSTLLDHGRRLDVPREGSWRFDAGWTVTFTPAAGFSGFTTPVTYRVYDVNGGSATGSESVIVQSPPEARPDTATTPQNVDVAVDVVANDVAGRSADARRGTLDRASVRFATAGQPAGGTTTVDDRVLTVPREAVYTADPTTGVVTVDPEPGFVGTLTPVRYTVRDTVRRTDGTPVHNLATGTLTVTTTPIVPVAREDRAVTTFGVARRVEVLDNDGAGAASAPLDPASVRLQLRPGLPEGSSLSDGGRTLTLTGVGVHRAGADGVVTFTPAPGFTGRVPTVGYGVRDTNGTPATASLTLRVDGAAVLRPTTATTRAGQPVVVDVLSNDDPPSGAGWDRTSVCLVVGGTCTKHVTRSGVGTWDVNADGTIQLASLVGFTGDTTVTYSVRDTVVGTYTSTLTVSVSPAREALGD